MPAYKAMYLHLFNVVTNALEALSRQEAEQAAVMLAQAQQDTEELYLQSTNARVVYPLRPKEPSGTL